MTQNDGMILKYATKAIKAGNIDTGKRLLDDILQGDPQNEQAWLWLALITYEPIKRHRYLKRVLKINPNNKHARRGISQLSQNRNLAYTTKTKDKPPSTSFSKNPGQITIARIAIFSTIIVAVIGCVGTIITTIIRIAPW